jgi:branched-chain amino acid aminotransferase
VNAIQYLDEKLHIPTMDTGAEVAKRAYEELNDIQYGRRDHPWTVMID